MGPKQKLPILPLQQKSSDQDSAPSLYVTHPHGCVHGMSTKEHLKISRWRRITLCGVNMDVPPHGHHSSHLQMSLERCAVMGGPRCHPKRPVRHQQCPNGVTTGRQGDGAAHSPVARSQKGRETEIGGGSGGGKPPYLPLYNNCLTLFHKED